MTKTSPTVLSTSQPDYVLMPREATRAMTMAGCDMLPSCEHVFGHAGEMLRNAYRKMVEVAALSTSQPDLKAAMKRVEAVCEDNAPASCDHKLALDFVLQIATAALAATPAVGHMHRSELDDASNACLELCTKHGFATGHGDTVADMIREIDGQIATPAVGGEHWEKVNRIFEGWLGRFEDGPPIEFTPAREYAAEAIRDCQELVLAALAGKGGS